MRRAVRMGAKVGEVMVFIVGGQASEANDTVIPRRKRAHAFVRLRSPRYHLAIVARIVLTTFGSLGDIHPYLGLAGGLRARGHRVALATHAFYRAKIEAEGIEFFPVRPDADPEDRALIALAMDLRKGPERVLRDIVLPVLRESYEDLRSPRPAAPISWSGILSPLRSPWWPACSASAGRRRFSLRSDSSRPMIRRFCRPIHGWLGCVSWVRG
jgi:hypothetical protein